MFSIERGEDGTLRLIGRFDAARAGEAEAVLEAITGSAVVDLSRLEYISSAGLSVLLRAWKRAQESGGTVRVVNPSPSVRTVFRYAGLDEIFALD